MSLIFSDKKRKREEKDKPLEKLTSFSKIFGGGGDCIDKSKNHIYFYEDVTTESCLALNRELMAVGKDLLQYALDHDCEPAKIYLHINSYGGELMACFSTIDYILNSPVPVVTIIEGCAASAATLISVVAHERYMMENSYMLIHQLRSGYWGKYSDLQEDMKNNKLLMNKIYKIYKKHTHIKKDELKRILKKDLWWDLKKCQKLGLVDGVYQSNKRVKYEEEENLE